MPWPRTSTINIRSNLTLSQYFLFLWTATDQATFQIPNQQSKMFFTLVAEKKKEFLSEGLWRSVPVQFYLCFVYTKQTTQTNSWYNLPDDIYRCYVCKTQIKVNDFSSKQRIIASILLTQEVLFEQRELYTRRSRLGTITSP